MRIEKTVLHRVEEVLGQSRKACFYNGTLFVECDADRAAKVTSMLNEMEIGRIIVSPMPRTGEFAFDIA